MSVCSIVIPVAGYHEDLSNDAIRSAEAQTLRCPVIVVHDRDGFGAGWARNQGVSQVETPFVVFLDADDLLDRRFVERAITSYRRAWFVYTDWYNQSGKCVELPDTTEEKGWYAGRVFHLVTTLLPTALFRHVGGFDETLSAMEDTDLYLRLRRVGVCGVRHPEPLVTYQSAKGLRGRMAAEQGLHYQLQAEFRQKYGGYQMGCGCQSKGGPALPQGSKQAGDVLAFATWSGNRVETSWYGPRRYRGGNGKPMWVDPRDVQARPKLWSTVSDPEADAPDVERIVELARAAMA